MQKTEVVGKEFDEDLRKAVIATLREMGATKIDHWWGVGGSQEVAHLEVEIDGSAITIETETDMGLSISGEAEVVDRILMQVREKMGRLRDN